MDKKVITIIILLTTVSLIGALITQLFWVKDAWLLKEDQFNNSINLSMKRIVNELMTYEGKTEDNFQFVSDNIAEHDLQFFSYINPKILDSLIKKEFDGILGRENYEYGVYRDSTLSLITGSFTGETAWLVNSPHQESLTCICQEDNYILAVYIPHQSSILLGKIIVLPVMSGLFLLVLLLSFFLIIFFIFRQKKLSEMKTDFVNNMTHELKTPIATISVSAEMMTKEMVITSPEKIHKYAGIILEENSRLKTMVDRVLQIATIEKEDYHVRIKDQDVHQMITDCVNKYSVHVRERNGIINTNLKATQTVIKTDSDHFMNILYNLLDNANKYSPVSPDINIKTSDENGTIFIVVEDKGIGISRENQQAVFRKFQRLQHGDIHDVKGFGIGLFYVKTMVEKLGGKIELQSELNKGSSFILSFPV